MSYRDLSYQYDSEVQPVSTSPETVSVDRFGPTLHDGPVWPKKVITTAILAGSFFFPSVQPQPESVLSKWEPEHIDVVLPRHQTRPGISVVDPTVLLEGQRVIELDKWEPRGYTPTWPKLRLVPAGETSHDPDQFLVVADEATPDMWEPRGARGIVGHRGFLQVTGLATGVHNLETSLDRWEPRLFVPVLPRHQVRPGGMAVIDPTILLEPGAPPVTPDMWRPAGGYIVGTAGELHPGTSIAAVYNLEETDQLDKWEPTLPTNPVLPKHQTRTGISAFDFEPVPAAEEETLDQWEPRGFNPIFVPHQVRPGLFVIDPEHLNDPERSTPDKWLPEYPDILLPLHQTRPGLFVIDPDQLTQPEATTLDRWEPSIPDFARTRDPLVRGKPVTDPDVLLEAEETSIDRYEPQFPDLLLPRHQTRTGWFTVDPDQLASAEDTSIDRYEPQFPDLLLPLHQTRPGLSVVDPDLLTQPESSTLDRWEPQYPDWFPPIHQTRPGLSVVDPTQLVVPLDRYEPFYPDILLPRHLTRPGTKVIDPDVLLDVEATTVDRWEPQVPDLLLPRHQTRPGISVIDPDQLTQPERSTPDKWIPQYPDILLPVHQTRPGLSVVDPDQLNQDEAVSLDKFEPRGFQPVLPRHQTMPGGISAFNFFPLPLVQFDPATNFFYDQQFSPTRPPKRLVPGQTDIDPTALIEPPAFYTRPAFENVIDISGSKGYLSETTEEDYAKSSFYFDKSDYDQVTDFLFGAVARNNDSVSRDISIIDSGDNVVGTISVANGVSAWTRQTEVSWTPNEGADVYRLRLEGTTSGNQLGAHPYIIIQQAAGWRKTNLQYTMLGRFTQDEDDFQFETGTALGSVTIDNVASNTFQNGSGLNTAARHAYWLFQNLTKYAGKVSGFRVETVLAVGGTAGSSRATLYDTDADAAIGSELVSTTLNTPTHQITTYNVGDLEDGHTHAIWTRTTGAFDRAKVYRGELHILITEADSPGVIEQAIRLHRTRQAPASESTDRMRRRLVLPDVVEYAALEGSFRRDSDGDHTYQLRDDGASDSGTAGSLIPGSAVTSKTGVTNGVHHSNRTGNILGLLTDGNRYTVDSVFSAGDVTLAEGHLILGIGVTKSPFIGPDKYEQRGYMPTWPKKRLVPGETFHDPDIFLQGTPLVVTPDKFHTEYPDQILPMHQTQTGVFVVDPDQLLQPEVTTPDKWLPQYPDQLLPRHQVRPGISVIDPDQLASAEETTLDRWEPSLPDFARTREPLVRGKVTMDPDVLLEAEAVTIDRYEPQYPDILLPKHQTRPGWFTVDADQLTQAERSTIDKWEPQYPDILLPRHQVRPGLNVIDPDQLTQGEEITPDKWLGEQPDLLLPRHQLREGFTIDANFAGAIEEELLIKWTPYLEVPMLPRHQTRPGIFVIDPEHLGDAETITFDKWAPTYPDQLLPEHQTRPGLFVTDPTQLVVPLDRYEPFYPDILLPRHLTRPGQKVVDPDVLLEAEVTTVDRWEPQAPDILLPKLGVRPQLEVIDPEHLQDPEATLLSKWEPQLETPVLPEHQVQTGLTELIEVIAEPEVELDKWEPREFVPVLPRHQTQTGFFDLELSTVPVPPGAVLDWEPELTNLIRPLHQTRPGLSVIDPTALLDGQREIEFDKWNPSLADVVRPKLRLVPGQNFSDVDDVVPPVFVDLDRWEPRLYTPVRPRHQVDEGWFTIDALLLLDPGEPPVTELSKWEPHLVVPVLPPHQVDEGWFALDFLEGNPGSIVVTPGPADSLGDAVLPIEQDGTAPGSNLTDDGKNEVTCDFPRNTVLVDDGKNDVDFLDTEGGVGGFVADQFFIKKGDLSKAIEIELVGEDLTGVVVGDIRFIMKSTLKPSGPAPKIDTSTGVSITGVTAPATLKYTWSGSDTDTAGVFLAEFEVDFTTASGGTRGPETFPNDSHIEVNIVQDLGGQFP